MPLRNSLPRVLFSLATVLATSTVVGERVAEASAHSLFQGALLPAGEVTEARITELRAGGTTAIVVNLDGRLRAHRRQERLAASCVRRCRLKLFYWIEIARCPELADAHPDWMASLQGHEEWRRIFPDTPRPGDGEVVKTYPWVPILSQETFRAQLRRVRRTLTDVPPPDGVFLNDLQGAPSACGCGNPLCRWTSDYGKKRTTTPTGDDAAALFVKAVQESLPGSAVIPVWTTECERHDAAPDGLCAGVGCFQGNCWKAYAAQLRPVEQHTERLAVLVPYRAFQRDLAVYGRKAGWIRHAVESFAIMPPRHGGAAVEASRLITVLEGWHADDADVDRQVRVAVESGVGGFVIAYTKIDQSWSPKLVRHVQRKGTEIRRD